MISIPGAWDLAAIREIAFGKPDMSPEEIGFDVARRLTNAQLADFAARDVAGWVGHFRREAARETERAAMVPTPPAASNANAEFEHWRDNPMYFLGNVRTREKFRRWMGDDFTDWYRRGLEKVRFEHGEKEAEYFISDWYEGGQRAYFRRKLVEQLTAETLRMVEETARQVRLETTQELLNSMFALGDGRQVTWGSATIADHEQRIALLVGNAAGNVEAAARHKAAIDMLTAAGAETLADLNAAAAA